ncbi:MAG: type I restriction enzyme HsdR N-terminal domain-containing protein [Anaerolineales bacterium]|nr:type I restriction enzyme HsdR N-terminal domain-containing protein [Anaerolineales bacterium]
MDFIDRIKQLASRVPAQLEYCKTEEATKNALVMPFINALGYDVFNPIEVMPEFMADVGIKKGEKVDYAIMQGGAPIILFECKWSGATLDIGRASQLLRYFHAVKEVRFGILTNGVEYQFFSDLDTPNRMDDKPFLIFNILDFQERDIQELRRFRKSSFDIEEILSNASELKYTEAIHKLLIQEFDEPTDDFMEFFTRQVYSGRLTQGVKEQFSPVVKRALRRFLNERINARLQTALGTTDETTKETAANPEESAGTVDTEESEDGAVREDRSRGISTTEDEIEGFFAVKSILRSHIDVKRVHMRDTKSYCGILLDDNNRKPICRLRFNRSQYYLGWFDDERNEQTAPIDEIDDIYKYSEQIIATTKRYDLE